MKNNNNNKAKADGRRPLLNQLHLNSACCVDLFRGLKGSLNSLCSNQSGSYNHFGVLPMSSRPVESSTYQFMQYRLFQYRLFQYGIRIVAVINCSRSGCAHIMFSQHISTFSHGNSSSSSGTVVKCCVVTVWEYVACHEQLKEGELLLDQ